MIRSAEKSIVLGMLLCIGIFFSYFTHESRAISGLEGRILLDVERHGEAWYVDPQTHTRFYLGRPHDAFQVMRTRGVGIDNTLLNSYLQSSFPTRHAGKIFLDVQNNGEAYYVHPQTLKGIYLGSPLDSFTIMQSEGLGISRVNLSSIPLDTYQLSISNAVPFAPQAPFGDWDDLRLAESCEEASVLMALGWAQATTGFDYRVAQQHLIDISEWQKTTYGEFIDTSLHDTADRLLKTYHGYTNYEVVYDITEEDILEELYHGNIMILHINGTLLGNRFYSGEGPVQHAIVLHGYDPVTNEFIISDPGTRRGDDMRFPVENIIRALQDYETGNRLPLPDRNGMIVVQK
jgi:hypothetical protein